MYDITSVFERNSHLNGDMPKILFITLKKVGVNSFSVMRVSEHSFKMYFLIGIFLIGIVLNSFWPRMILRMILNP